MTAKKDSDIGPLLSALSHPIRRQILDLLVDAGPRSATDLAEYLPISRQAVAKHIAILEEARLVRPERCGKEVKYRIAPEPLRELGRWLARTSTRWDRRLLALKHAAESCQD